MLVSASANVKQATVEETKTVKERLRLLINALMMDRCTPKAKEDSIKSLCGRGSLLWQLVEVMKDGKTELPLTRQVDGVDLRDYFWLLGESLNHLNPTNVVQRPDTDGT